MKILLDECVTRKIKATLVDYEVYTVFEMGFSGLKNGKLLEQAEKEGFDILLTIDKNINYQQNIRSYNLSVVILDVFDSHFKQINKLIPDFLSGIDSYRPGSSYLIKIR